MSVAAFYPYRSEAVRAEYFRHYDELAAAVWPVAAESRVVPTSWGETFVRAAGPEGAPVLLLLPGAAATSLMWAPNIARLSERLRTYAVDQVGEVGRSSCRRALASMDDLVAWLRELADGLAPGERVSVAGVSYGGALAAQFALQAPERVRKAVLLAPGATVYPISRWFMARLMASAVAPRWVLPGLVRWMFADMVRLQPRWVEETTEELRVVMRTLVPRKVPLPGVVPEAQWQTLRVPVLFLVGEHETIYPARKAAERMRRVAPAVRVEVVPGAGHDLTFAQTELVNERMVAFLTEPE